MSLPFTATRFCPKLPIPWIGKKPAKPLPDVDDDAIDAILLQMIAGHWRVSDLPRSQYGRRIAVERFCFLHDRRELAKEGPLPAQYTVGQPR